MTARTTITFAAALIVAACSGSAPTATIQTSSGSRSSAAAPFSGTAHSPGSPIVATIPVGESATAAPMGLARFGDKIAVELHEENRFELIDPKTNTVDGYLDAPVHGFFIVVGAYLWATDRSSNTVSRVDVATGKVTLTFKVPGASAILPTPDGLWVGSAAPDGGWTGTLTLVDPKDGRVLRTRHFAIHGQFGPSLVAGSLWVTGDDGTGLALFRLDPNDGRQQARLDYAPETVGFAFGTIWLTSRHGGRILRLDPANNHQLVEFRLSAPDPPVVDGNGLWLVDYEAGTIARIDPTTNAVSKPVPLGVDSLSGPLVAFGSLWVAGHDDNVVLRLDPANLQSP